MRAQVRWGIIAYLPKVGTCKLFILFFNSAGVIARLLITGIDLFLPLHSLSTVANSQNVQSLSIAGPTIRAPSLAVRSRVTPA